MVTEFKFLDSNLVEFFLGRGVWRFGAYGPVVGNLTIAACCRVLSGMAMRGEAVEVQGFGFVGQGFRVPSLNTKPHAEFSFGRTPHGILVVSRDRRTPI